MNTTKTVKEAQLVSILGTGWIGLALAESLRNNGKRVKCSASDGFKLKLLVDKGHEAFVYNPLEPMSDEVRNIIQDSDILVITYPPAIFSRFLAQLDSKVIFPNTIYLSSTSVYPEKSGVYTEEMAENRISAHSGIDLLEIENQLKKAIDQKLTILRLAGLFGPGRSPGRFIDAANLLTKPDAPVNMVHREDVIRVIEKVITKGMFGRCFNVCAPIHPTRLDFYTKAVWLDKKLNIRPAENTGIFRVISSEKLMHELNYSFIHENPLNAIE
jgi:nucleoside-diphosphate-sugar epimerase